MKKMTNEEFIEKAKKVHGDKYDYSLVEYINTNFKVKIICPEHALFEQSPKCHLKHGCPICSTNNKIENNKNLFIKKAIKKYGDKYDYSLLNYKNIDEKVKIICKIHGIFEQTPRGHLKYVCQKCYESIAYSNTEKFIEKAIKRNGNKYDYSLVNYINRKIPVKIICKEHGVFEQIPYAHLKGANCNKCVFEGACESTEDFINRAKKIHGDKYDYSLAKYENVTNKLKIICKEHGVFLQNASSHLIGRGCPICKNSKGEEKVSIFLKNKNIKFEREKRFYNCRNILPLPFDFFLPDYNICIEFDGIQHFRQNTDFFTENLIEIKKRDEIKNIYCKENNIILHRISYKNINLVEKKLEEIFK